MLKWLNKWALLWIIISFEGDLIFCLSEIFGVDENIIYEDYLDLRELIETEVEFINRTDLIIAEIGK